MSPRARLLVALAVAVAAFLTGLFVLLRSADPEPTVLPPVATTTAPAPAPTPTTTGPETVGVAIAVAAGRPVDGIQRVTVSKGDLVRIEVSGAPGEEVHLHGYDKALELGADGAGTLAFEATLQGVFELELEHAGVQVGELTVR